MNITHSKDPLAAGLKVWIYRNTAILVQPDHQALKSFSGGKKSDLHYCDRAIDLFVVAEFKPNSLSAKRGGTNLRWRMKDSAGCAYPCERVRLADGNLFAHD